MNPEAMMQMDQTVGFSAAVLGERLPHDAERHRRSAAETYDRDDVALRHLTEAHMLGPEHPATLIGLHRFYFYEGRLPEAPSIVKACLTPAAIDKLFELDPADKIGAHVLRDVLTRRGTKDVD